VSDRNPSPRPTAGRDLLRLLAGMVAVTALMLAIGFTLTRLPALAGVRSWDVSVSEWFVTQRTATLDSLSDIGSTLSDTPVAIAVTVLAVVGLRLWLGRWRESAILAAAILGELLYFLALTALVGRERPDVPQLDAAPPTSSYPSGHTGAAVALYGCLALLLWWRVRDRRLSVPLAAVLLAVPLVVAVSRVYRGMHFVTDVASGALGGLLWLGVVLAVLILAHRPEAVPEAATPEGAQPPPSEVARSAG
jgi:membrane-associated phospholipid phosphatase